MRQDKHNAELLHRVRAELSRSGMRRDARDPERGSLLSSPENLKCFENITVAFLNGNTNVEYHDGLVHMLCPLMGCGLTDEADLFHCFQSLMQRLEQKLRGIGIRQYAAKFITVFRELLPELHEHFEDQEICFDTCLNPWLTGMLSAQVPMSAAIELWDIYLSKGFFIHSFVCISFLSTMKDELEELMEQQEIMSYLKHVPVVDVDQVLVHAENLYSTSKSIL